MGRFNTAVEVPKTKVKNLAGGDAYSQDPKMELASILLTSFANNQFYRDANETFDKLSGLIPQLQDKSFAAKAAVFARTEYGMRSITHVLAAELAPFAKGQTWGKKFYDKIVYRPDDMGEIVSYYMSRHGNAKPSGKKGGSLPAAIRDGFSRAFGRFDTYSLSKYRGEGNEVKLIDLVRMVHPKPTEKNADALQKLVKGNLKATETWEVKLTQAGQTASNEEEKADLKKEAWGSLLKEKKLGYFALLRNLRNILQQAPELIDLACEQLVNENAIKKSLVLPFRFVTAYNEIQMLPSTTSRKIMKAIGKAIEISLNNIPQIPGRTLVALDMSGSMQGKPAEIGSLFAAALVKTNDCDMLMFSDDGTWVQLNTDDSLMTLQKLTMQEFMCGGTNFNLIFNMARIAKKSYDRIIILSDMQGWMGDGYGWHGGSPVKSYNQYKEVTGADPFIYSFDLQGYGSMMFPQPKVFCLAGFSDKVFDLFKLLEEDKQALVSKIEAVIL